MLILHSGSSYVCHPPTVLLKDLSLYYNDQELPMFSDIRKLFYSLSTLILNHNSQDLLTAQMALILCSSEISEEAVLSIQQSIL